MTGYQYVKPDLVLAYIEEMELTTFELPDLQGLQQGFQRFTLEDKRQSLGAALMAQGSVDTDEEFEAISPHFDAMANEFHDALLKWLDATIKARTPSAPAVTNS
jgi:hypothetical protein